MTAQEILKGNFTAEKDLNDASAWPFDLSFVDADADYGVIILILGYRGITAVQSQTIKPASNF
ncbi:hypothetical protein OCU04_009904 [Sclerotinia nivalis]|uniref:Uncharacterized protein n=1 Tax=Sclerotinia nivalis TaxID=352851 RepID=A0A9X0ADL6_9HELO|nr:hypothetical protein OCU04_009904 [Sclerotinia nivalis]